MARRSAVQDGSTSDALEESGLEPYPAQGKTKRGWSGGGGRWWIWIGRALLWTFVIVVIVNGIRAPFQRFTADPAAPAPAATKAGDGFPVTPASAYALQFGQVYLNYDVRTAADRQTALQSFLAEGSGDAQFGWNGQGQLRAQSVQVSSVEARDLNNGVVTLLAQTGATWLQLAVPIYAKDGALAVSGPPALLPAPKRAALPQAADYEHDTELEAALKDQLTGFFKAYGANDTVNLQRFSDGEIQGLSSGITFSELGEVDAPTGSADERTVRAKVTWTMPPAADRGATAGLLTQVYELTMVRKGDDWNVRSIRGATP